MKFRCTDNIVEGPELLIVSFIMRKVSDADDDDDDDDDDDFTFSIFHFPFYIYHDMMLSFDIDTI